MIARARVRAFEADPDPSSNEVSESTWVSSGADLAVAKTDDVGGFTFPGQPITYTISATNHGPEDVYGAALTDEFPAEIEGPITWSCLSTPGSWCTPSGEGDIVDTVDLLSGGAVIYSALGTVGSAVTGTIVNTATIEAPAGLGDPDGSNNAATAQTRSEDPVAVLFVDGFETGDMTAWSDSVPPQE